MDKIVKGIVKGVIGNAINVIKSPKYITTSNPFVRSIQAKSISHVKNLNR